MTFCKIRNGLFFVLAIFTAQIASAQQFLFENFNGAPGSTFPTGWTAVRNGDPNTDWVIQTPAPTKFPAITMLGNNFAYVDADAGGSGSTTNSTLTSPAFNTASSNLLYLEFYQAYRVYQTDSAIVEVFNGTSWVAVQKKFTNTPTAGGTPGAGSEKVTFNISALKNANMRVRFRYVGPWPWFWAVDNVRVFSPPASDIGVLEITSPTGGCGLTASAQIKVKVTNYGSANQTSIPLRYKVNSGAVVSETFPTSLAAGATQEYTFTTPVDFSASGDYFISSWSALSGDVITANDSVKNYKVTKGSATSFGNLSFSNFNGVNLSTIYPGWREGEGIAPDGITGTFRQSEDVQTFAFNTKTACVNLFTNSRKEWIVSPPFVPTDVSGLLFKAAVTEWLTAVPDAMGSDDKVQVMVSTNCGANWTPIRTYDRTSGLTNQLTNQSVSLVSYAGQEIQLAFYATDGTIDDPEDYDFHLDSIRVNNLPPNEVAVGSITSPLSGCAVAAPALKVQVFNQGTNNQTNFPICARINGGAAVCQNFSGTLNAGASAEFTFTNLPVLNTPGDYNIRVYTNLSNDYDRSNDTTGNYFFQNIPNVTTFPYSQSFESNNGGWIPGGTFSSWALGTPNKTVIKGAGLGTKAYVTGGLGNGTYNANEKSFVLGPCMNFSTLPNPVFEMKAWWSSEFSEDGAVLQSSTDGGTTWEIVGKLNDVSNWHNDNTVDGISALLPATVPPTGRTAWSGGLNDDFGSKGWVTVKNDLKGLGGKASVRLRIAFGSGLNNAGDGFGFDDVRIYEKADRDLAIVAFERPLASCGLSDTSRIKIRVKNVGKLSVSNPSFAYKRGTSTPVVQTSTAVIDTNAFYTYTFSGTENLSAITSYNFDGWVNLLNDAYRSNDTIKRARFTKRGLFTDTIRFEGFTGPNLPVLYSGWSSVDGNPLPNAAITNWRNAQPNQQTFFGRNVARLNMFGNTRASWILGPAHLIQPNAFLNFDVAITEGFDITNDNTGGFNGTDDKLRVMVSNNCGDSWTEIFAVKAGDGVDSTFKRFKANLSAYAGQEIRFAFWGTSFPNIDPNQYDLFLDNIFLETIDPFDGGVSSFTAPLTSCGLTDAVQVKVNVKNYGSQPIGNFPVFYKINQSNPVTETFSQTLQPGASASYTFATTADLSQSQPYVLTAGTNVTGDNNTTNNNAVVDLVKVNSPFPPQLLTGFTGSNLSNIWAGWNEAKNLPPAIANSAWVNGSFAGQTVLKISLIKAQKDDWVLSPGIKLGTGNILKFRAGQFSVNGTNPATFDIDDSVSVVVSTNCGTSWKTVFKLGSNTSPALTNNMQPYFVNLSAFNNQEIRIGFRAKDGNRDDFNSDIYLSQVEVISSVQLDASPAEILITPSIVTKTFIQDTTYTISAKVANFGSQAITNVVTGVFLSSENITLKDTIEATIEPGQSYTTLLGTFTPTVVGTTFKYKLYSALAGDEAPTNDTLVEDYKVLPITSTQPELAAGGPPRVYPNPTQSELFITVPPVTTLKSVRVLDMLGRELSDVEMVRISEQTQRLEMAPLPAGLYLIEVYYGDTYHRVKVKVE